MQAARSKAIWWVAFPGWPHQIRLFPLRILVSFLLRFSVRLLFAHDVTGVHEKVLRIFCTKIPRREARNEVDGR
jgi:hypothetical protein